ncbi:unnamed protein product [Rhizophagus irregularis]|nr:unnamed protein product [Rhizophagus irregularis]
MIKRFRSTFHRRNPGSFFDNLGAWNLRSWFRLFDQILALSSTTLALWNFRSRFFSISALRFEIPVL